MLTGRVGKSSHGFADLLRFLYAICCRPSEAFHVEAPYHRADRCVIYPGHPGPDDFVWKNCRRTCKDRVIFLPDDVAQIVESRIEKHPTGPIFRTNRGSPWASVSVSVNLRWYAKRLGIAPPPSAYGFRYTYATDWLLNGGSIKVLADFIGTSVSMIERHYGQIMVDNDRVRSITPAPPGGTTSGATWLRRSTAGGPPRRG